MQYVESVFFVKASAEFNQHLDLLLVYLLVFVPVLQLHGGGESVPEGGRFPHEEGARLLCHGPGETSEALPGHPRRVRAFQSLHL